MNRAYSKLTRASGSKSFFPSELSTLDQFEKIEEVYLALLNEALERATAEYEADIRAAASLPENWGSLGSSITASFDPNDYSINVGLLGDPETVSQAMALEYGTGVIPPKAMLRKSALGVSTEFPSVLNRYTK